MPRKKKTAAPAAAPSALLGDGDAGGGGERGGLSIRVNESYAKRFEVRVCVLQ